MIDRALQVLDYAYYKILIKFYACSKSCKAYRNINMKNYY